MASEMLKEKIHDTLKAGSFPDPDYFVDVFDDSDEHIRILVISRKFDIYLTSMNTNVQNAKTGSGRTLSKCYPKTNLNAFLALSPSTLKKLKFIPNSLSPFEL